jgi:hypothetical protein
MATKSKPKTASSTPRLSEYARKFVYPPGIVKTVWPRVEAKGRELGLGFDWWQSQLGTVCLGYSKDGKYVATVGGIGLSIPRQVGKTSPRSRPPSPSLVDIDRVWVSIGAASAGDVPHLGPRWKRRLDVDRAFIVSEAKRIQAETSCVVVIDRKGPAGSTRGRPGAAGVNVTAAGLEDYVTACADLFDAVNAKEVTHGAYPELDAAVAAATQRKVGDRWAWARRSGDISMLEAVTLAHWAAEPSVYEDRGLVIL